MMIRLNQMFKLNPCSLKIQVKNYYDQVNLLPQIILQLKLYSLQSFDDFYLAVQFNIQLLYQIYNTKSMKLQDQSLEKKKGNQLQNQISQLKSELKQLKQQMHKKEYGQLLASEGIKHEHVANYVESYDKYLGDYNSLLKLKQGPVKNDHRSCTNVFCCGILCVLVVFMLVMGIYAWTGPKFKKLSVGYDAEGHSCGGYYTDYPYIYFVAPTYDTLWRTVCVKSCPNQSTKQLQCVPNKFVTSCSENNSTNPQQSIDIYDSKPIGGVICLPVQYNVQKQIKQAANQSSFAARLIVLQKIWPMFVLAIPMAMFLTVLFMFIIKQASKGVVYVLLALSVLACPAFGIYLLVTPSTSKTASNFSHIIGYALSIGIINFGIIIFMGLCFYRRSIKRICDIVRLSARFISQNMSILVLPFLFFFITAMYIVLCIFQAIGYYTLGTTYYNEKQLPFQHFIMTWSVKSLMLLHIFHIIWVVFFLIDCNQFIISGAVVNWYYEEVNQIQQQQENKLLTSMKRFSKFHTGSVAMGSFLMTLFGFIKFLYTSLMSQQSQKLNLKWKNSIKSFIETLCCCCTKYIFNCLNSGTYTYINLFGRQYCHSSIDVLCLKMGQIVCTPIITFLNTVFSILIKVGITGLTVLIAYIVLNTKYKEQVQDKSFSLVVVGLITFVISSFFVSLYSAAMESVYVCFLVDCSEKKEQRQRSFKILENILGNHIAEDPKNNQPLNNTQKQPKDSVASVVNKFKQPEQKKPKKKQNPSQTAFKMKKIKQMIELKKIVYTFHDVSQVPGNLNNILNEMIKIEPIEGEEQSQD